MFIVCVVQIITPNDYVIVNIQDIKITCPAGLIASKPLNVLVDL